MMICLIHNAQTGQMQFSMEPVDPAMAVQLLQQAVMLIQQQTGVITPSATPALPPEPRKRNIREIIVPKGQEPNEDS